MISLPRRGLIGLGLGTGLAGLVGCSNEKTSGSSEVGFVQGDGSYSKVAVADRVAVPVLSGEDLTGKPLTTKGQRGKVLVLNVWGSWCSPCRKEAPELVKAAKQLQGTADFIGINTRDNSADTALAFTREFDKSYPNFFDPDGVLLLELSMLPPKAIPSTLIIDRQGRGAARILGATTATTLVGLVHDVAAGK